MSNIRFEWDANKAAANQRKHGVTFDEARTVFFDENAKLINDPDHSDDEDRFVMLGLSSNFRFVLACHCYREQGNVIRIISARKASTQESKQYRWRSNMRKEYDFSNARKNPYASQLKKQITIRLDEDSIGYFKGISEQVGIPYQSLINLYLRDCAAHNRKLNLRWK
jgi:uncharacterized DUF497 family protein